MRPKDLRRFVIGATMYLCVLVGARAAVPPNGPAQSQKSDAKKETLGAHDKTIADAVVERLEKLQNVTAEFKQRSERPDHAPERDFLPGAVKRNGGWEKRIAIIAESERKFSFLAGAVRYENRWCCGGSWWSMGGTGGCAC